MAQQLWTSGMIAAFFSFSATPLLAEGKPNVEDIVKKATDKKSPDSSVSKVELTIKKDGDAVVKLFKASNLKVSKDETYTLIEFEKPTKMKILAYVRSKGEDDRWVKTSEGQARRVTQGGGDQSFVQSHFSYSDLEFGKDRDVKNELVCEGEKCEVDFAGTPHYKVKVTPQAGGIYAYEINFINTKNWDIDKIEYYASGDKKLKELVVDERKLVSGYEIPTQVTMKMEGSADASVMKTLDINVDVKDLTKQKFDKNLL